MPENYLAGSKGGNVLNFGSGNVLAPRGSYLTQGKPSLRERVTGWIADRLGGNDPRASYRAAERYTAALDFTGLGALFAGDEGVRMIGQGVKAGSPAAIAGGVGLAALGIVPEAKGIRAFHGSPYKFDKFDLAKIGTGEGAQAYGHGLYFAEHEPVAREYRDNLSPTFLRWREGGASHVLRGSPDDDALRTLDIFNGNYDAARASIEGAMQEGRRLGDDKSLSRYQRSLDTLNRLQSGEVSRQHGGHMYEVNIAADPNRMLDWDKPLSGQSKDVRQTIEPLLSAEDLNKGGNVYWDVGKEVQRRNSLAYREGLPRMRPNETYEEWNARKLIKNPPPLKKSDISVALQDSGIPGIKYFDQGSRQAGQGTRNYVVFDPGLVTILRRYAIPFLAGNAAVSAAMNAQENSLRPQVQ